MSVVGSCGPRPIRRSGPFGAARVPGPARAGRSCWPTASASLTCCWLGLLLLAVAAVRPTLADHVDRAARPARRGRRHRARPRRPMSGACRRRSCPTWSCRRRRRPCAESRAARLRLPGRRRGTAGRRRRRSAATARPARPASYPALAWSGWSSRAVGRRSRPASCSRRCIDRQPIDASPAVRRGDPAADPAAQRRPPAARRHPRPGRPRRAPARRGTRDGPVRPRRRAVRQRRRPAGRARPGRGRAGRLGDRARHRDAAIADAWASQQPSTANRSQARSHPATGDVSALVVPLVAGVRTVGLLIVWRPTAPARTRRPWSARITALAAPAALRLEAALLFDEVRSLATNEERQRLAREIHDGVAQELVMVGYGIDNALAVLPDDAPRPLRSCASLRGRGHPGDHRAAAVASSSCAARSTGTAAWPRRSPSTPAPSARRPACGCTCRSTSRRPDCRPRSRRNCCASPRRRSPTRASTPARRICG